MKQNLFALLLVLSVNILFAKGNYQIKPKGYTETNSPVTGTNQLSSMNKVGGSFRLKEYSAPAQKVIETDLVTFFIAKNHETNISVHFNCAKPVQLHYILADKNNNHKIKFKEEGSSYRLVRDLDISSFKNGICTLAVYNENNELIHTIEFEKTTL